MTEITPLAIESWAGPCSAQDQSAAITALEDGNVLLLPQLDFPLRDNERELYFQSAGVEVKGKNISLNLADNSVRGSHADAAELAVLRDMMVRFATDSRALVHALLPGYVASIEQGRTSFRPVEVAGRPSSWRKDDARLHVDSFPSSPTRGKRILRLFTNVNPHGQGRHWRLGERFEEVALQLVRQRRGARIDRAARGEHAVGGVVELLAETLAAGAGRGVVHEQRLHLAEVRQRVVDLGRVDRQAAIALQLEPGVRHPCERR